MMVITIIVAIMMVITITIAIWPEFLPKLASGALSRPRRWGGARAPGTPGATLASFGKNSGQMVPDHLGWHNYGARWHKCTLLKPNGIYYYCYYNN